MKSRMRVCTAAEYDAAIIAAGGRAALTVLASHTSCDSSGLHIFTEWGTRGGTFVCSIEEHGGNFTFRVAEGGDS